MVFSEAVPVHYFAAGDFDHDGIANVDDPCPISGDTADQDQDGLPDDCDPQRTISGDCLVLFDGFTDRANDLDPRWIADTGATSGLTSGALVLTTTTTTKPGIVQFNFPVAADDVAVVGTFAPQALGEFFAGVSLSYEQLATVERALFGGAYALDVSSSFALAGSTYLGAQQIADPRTSPAACVIPSTVPFTGKISITRKLTGLSTSVEPGGIGLSCGHFRTSPIASNKIVIGLVNATASLQYVLASRRLEAGQLCPHSNKTM
ncbi:MAG: hypothetical protein KBG15_01035 [Kofleriaceae bacterium]|nr:hypothetical protein [Kofleriaceae bacterium]